jgi:hypothetical protein
MGSALVHPDGRDHAKSFRGAAVVGFGWQSLMRIAKTIFKIASKRGFVNRHRLFDRASRVATWTRTAVDRKDRLTRPLANSLRNQSTSLKLMRRLTHSNHRSHQSGRHPVKFPR